MDIFKTLELTPGCTEEDAKRNYRRLSFLYHPYKHPSDKKAEEAFKRVNNAYEMIKKDPSLLKKHTNAVNTEGTLYTELVTDIEDFYLEKKKTISLDKIIPCEACSGFGTYDIKRGLCALCKGTGYIDNKILGMMDRDKKCACPSCCGLGFKKEYTCKVCNGNKTSEVHKEYSFKIGLKDYQNKYMILSGKGNYYPNSVPGDIFVKLIIKPDSLIKIENNAFYLTHNITPVQDILEETCTVEVYGKKITFKLPLPNNTITIEDKRCGLVSPRKITIRTLITKPVLNNETKDLYQQILKIESGL